MPIYEYRCRSCAAAFDELAPRMSSATEEQAPACPVCSGRSTTRIVSQTVHLRGGTEGVGRAAYPTSWEQVQGADPSVLRYWRRRVEREQAEEARHPELVQLRARAAADRWDRAHPAAGTGDAGTAANRRPEPSWEQVPFITPSGGRTEAPEHDHPHPHGHAHPHPAPVSGRPVGATP